MSLHLRRLMSDEEEPGVADVLTCFLHVLLLCKAITVRGAEESEGV